MNSRLIQRAYNATIRDLLPRKLCYLNGVTSRSIRLLDLHSDIIPDYEEDYLDALKAAVDHGDDIILVGGGHGVSTVKCSRWVSPDGSVTTYEASAEMKDIIEEALRLNSTGAPIQVIGGIVETGVEVWGKSHHRHIPASGLPFADVLGLDCEGAELEILRELTIRPREIVVEYHGKFGAAKSAVETELLNLGYEVVSHEPDVDSPTVGVLHASRDA